jgi:hypothetical protein
LTISWVGLRKIPVMDCTVVTKCQLFKTNV